MNTALQESDEAVNAQVVASCRNQLSPVRGEDDVVRLGIHAESITCYVGVLAAEVLIDLSCTCVSKEVLLFQLGLVVCI